MQRTQPRTLTNKELLQYASDRMYEGDLDVATMAEVLRRLNWYTEGKEDQIASLKDSRQLELPL